MLGNCAQELTLCNHAAANTHGLQLLEEQFARIRDLNGTELGGILASTAHPDTIHGICNRKEAALPTHKAAKAVTTLHEALLRELGDSVGGYRISLHLTEAQTAFTCAPLCGLTCEHHKRARGTAVELVR